MTHDGHWTVLDHGVLTVDGTRRMLPVNDREVLVYSSEEACSMAAARGMEEREDLRNADRRAGLYAGILGARIPPPMSSPRVSLATDADAGVSLTVAARKAYRIRRRP